MRSATSVIFYCVCFPTLNASLGKKDGVSDKLEFRFDSDKKNNEEKKKKVTALGSQRGTETAIVLDSVQHIFNVK